MKHGNRQPESTTLKGKKIYIYIYILLYKVMEENIEMCKKHKNCEMEIVRENPLTTNLKKIQAKLLKAILHFCEISTKF